MTYKLVDLYTFEGKSLPETPWNVYPRPKLKRNSFCCLNGEWDFAESETDEIPNDFNEKIISSSYGTFNDYGLFCRLCRKQRNSCSRLYNL